MQHNAKKTIKEHLAEMAKDHGGSHMHVMDTENGFVVHKAPEGKAPTGPHEVSTLGGAIGHMRDCMEGE